MKIFAKILLSALALLPLGIRAQEVAIKTNLVYDAVAYAPNLGVEVGLGHRSTLDMFAGYNGWNRNGSATDNKKLVHFLGNVEYRYWLCQKFSGHFFGVHLLGADYNIGGHDLPWLFGKNSKDYRYEGWGAGIGVSYGYQFVLGNHWNLEATIGVGYIYLGYDKYDCARCGSKIANSHHNYFGPTRLGLSMMYVF